MLLDVLRAKSAEDQVGNYCYYLVFFHSEMSWRSLLFCFVSHLRSLSHPIKQPEIEHPLPASNPLRLDGACAVTIQNNDSFPLVLDAIDDYAIFDTLQPRRSSTTSFLDALHRYASHP